MSFYMLFGFSWYLNLKNYIVIVSVNYLAYTLKFNTYPRLGTTGLDFF